MCPASGTTTNSASGSRSTISSLCSFGIILSLSPVSTSVGIPAQRLQRAGLVQPGQRRVELRDHVDRRAGDHRVDVVAERRVDVGRRERQRAGDAETRSAATRRVRSANAGRRRIVHAATGKTAARTRVSSSGRPKFRSARLPLEVEISAAATDPAAEQLRPQRRQPHDRHAAHRVADQDHRPPRHPGLEDGGEVAGQLLDGRVLRSARGRTRRGRAGRRRPAGRRGGGRWRWPGSAARVRRWKVHERHRQRVAVDEDDGQRRVARADLLHRQQDAVVGLHERRAVGRPRPGAERVVLAQLRGGGLAAVRRRARARPPAHGDGPPG